MWLTKIIIKIIISRLPVKYSYWKKINIFKHGAMEDFNYSRNIFEGHFNDMNKYNKIRNPIIMEIGPGDSLFSMIYSRKYTTNAFYFIDVHNFANKNTELYLKLIKQLKSEGFLVDFNIKADFSFQELIEFCRTSYLTNGLKDLKKIKSNSVNYIFSHSVLEHIRLFELEEMIYEMYRILKPGGILSHNINYKDHLDESLNNLRFSTHLWESNLFANSGFYTNRVPAVKMHSLFRKVGLNMLSENFGSWDKLPISRSKINRDFNDFSDKELSISTSSLIGQK